MSATSLSTSKGAGATGQGLSDFDLPDREPAYWRNGLVRTSGQNSFRTLKKASTPIGSPHMSAVPAKERSAAG
jgi:hypothetical protein